MSKKDKEDRPDHAGSVAAEDEQLTLWLNRLWARGEPPERIELWQMFGRNRVVRGEMLLQEDFKPSTKFDIEHANKLANELLEAAQHDCDSLRREGWYEIAVIDRNRRASPVVRRIGPLQPKRTYALKTLGGVDDESDEDDVSAPAMLLRHIKEGFEQVRQEKNRNDRVVEGMLFLQNNIIKDQQAALDLMFNKVMTAFERQQEAEDRRVQRDILLEREKFKIALMRDGVRTARNLLPGLFGGTEAAEERPAPTNGASKALPATKYGSSPERALVGNFLHDIEEEGEAMHIALFGDFEERDGKLNQVKPGIFTPKQFFTLVGVRDGGLPPSALDELLPRSGSEHAITEDQIKRAMDAGLTEGIGMAIMELVGLRNRAKEAAAALNGTKQPVAE